MTRSLRRLAAIVRADLLVRFRRPSTLVVFLALGFTAYLWVPDPASGRGLLVIDGHRALLDSAAIGMATATLGSIFVGLVGFYVVSNALRRDVATRCGAVIASTPVRSVEYLCGKTLGNLAFLATFMGGFLLTSMAMVVVRGEAPLEPLVFLRQYALLVPGSIVLVSVVAIVFESIPWLAGRLGDVLYFFLWIGLLVPGAALSMRASSASPGLAAYLDPSGLGFLLGELRAALHTDEVSIGSTSTDPSLAPVVFHGLTLPPEWIPARLVSTLSPFLLLFLAVAFFHRFDPARTGRVAARAREGLLGRLQRGAKPLAAPLVAALMGRPRAGRATLLGAARRDAALTLGVLPAAVVALLVLWLVALALPAGEMLRGLLPFLFAVIAVVVADVPCRERRAGTVGLISAVPLLAPAFVRWKLLTVLALAGLFALVPLAEVAVASTANLLPLVVGLAFVASAATALGVVSSNPKTFLVLFLSFWYVVVNDSGHTAWLDFAGFYGAATGGVVATYALLAAAFYGVAELVYTRQRRRAG